jgi:hypothetical protein
VVSDETWPDPDDVEAHEATLRASVSRHQYSDDLELARASDDRLKAFLAAREVSDVAALCEQMDIPPAPCTEHEPRRAVPEMVLAPDRHGVSAVTLAVVDGDGPPIVDGVLPRGAVDELVRLRQGMRPAQEMAEKERVEAAAVRFAAWDPEQAMVHRGRLVEFAARIERYAKEQSERCGVVAPVWPEEWGPM